MVKTAYIPSNGIRKIPHLADFLPELDIQKNKKKAEVVVGWGLKPTTRKARAFAKENNLPFIALEDGFLRSLGLGVKGDPPFSMVVDDIGIYYDTSRTSRLEHLILAANNISSKILEDAQCAIYLICQHHLSKYNHAPDLDGRLHNQIDKEIVLVLDQTFGDMALQYGGADELTFKHMFQTAIIENPHAEIWVKTHPDVLCGKRQGYLTGLVQQNRVHFLAEDINPISLLKKVSKVYCVTSQMGFEALLCGKEVVTFGLPWYAGWGISDDRHPHITQLVKENRRASRSLLQLFAAAYLQYSRYINPNTGKAGTLFDVIDYLSVVRRLNEKLRGEIYCIGMSLWKRAVMKPFFNVPSCRLKFISSVKKLNNTQFRPDTRLLAWGNAKEEIIQFAQKHQLPLLRMEDGFIRSVGLGSNLVAPLSLVTDSIGIYFNAQLPSGLEYILQNQQFSAYDIQMASILKNILTEANISKYNVGEQQFTRPQTDKPIILVPGQVEDDASIRFGSPKIYRNIDLLKAVRAKRPDAYIVYKPHPDVVSGNRLGDVSEKDVAIYANQSAATIDILACMKYADEVHTMTSLTGFEALLRGKEVYCYGLPFYSGWGLTHDELTISRRTRRLTLSELIIGTLVYYPNYVHPETHCIIDAFTAIDLLQQKKQQENNTQLYRNWLSKQAEKIKQLYFSIRF